MWVINAKKGIFNEETQPNRTKMKRQDNKESFLKNLGRATMRGLRKCHKCGTLNGTRGYSCKNKNCDVVFKEANGKKKVLSEPCKITTGTSAQIFSVRVRDKGPDYRGFVQLGYDGTNSGSLMNETFPDELASIGMDVGSVSSSSVVSAKCFVDTCRRMKFSLSASETGISGSSCVHIQAATQCFKPSTSLTLKYSALNTLDPPAEVKDEVYRLATSTAGPLVQRVSKNIVVVKCQQDSLHPLGFLHFSFSQTKAKKDGDSKFYCPCRSFKTPAQYKISTSASSSATEVKRRCVHLYAVAAALASDDELAEEFEKFITFVKNITASDSAPSTSVVKCDPSPLTSPAIVVENNDSALSDEEQMEDERRSYFILNDGGTGEPCQVEVEVLPQHVEQDDLKNKLQIELQSEESLQLRTCDGGTISLHPLQAGDLTLDTDLNKGETDPLAIPFSRSLTVDKQSLSDNDPLTMPISAVGIRHEETNPVSSTLVTLQKGIEKKGLRPVSIESLGRKLAPSNSIIAPAANFHTKFRSSTEQNTTLNFTTWIASVVERINQTIYYGLPIKPEPLVFYITQTFFDCLSTRIDCALSEMTETDSTKKRRLMTHRNFDETFDSYPFGKSIKKTWKLTTLRQVESTFENNICGLLVERRFLRSVVDGSFLPTSGTLDSTILSTGNNHPILPKEYLTCLKIKPKNVPFIIEWTPNALPQTQVGELKLVYEIEHFCDGQSIIPRLLSPFKEKERGKQKRTRILAPLPLAPRPPEGIIPIGDSLSSNETITLLTF